jgi:hypothetical protein
MDKAYTLAPTPLSSAFFHPTPLSSAFYYVQARFTTIRDSLSEKEITKSDETHTS